jgi:hypothetical protein
MSQNTIAAESVRNALAEAIAKTITQSALAERIGNGVRTGHIYYWIKQGVVPIEHCAVIEQETGVKRWLLRPDDWMRIWPELIGAEGSPSEPAAAPGA